MAIIRGLGPLFGKLPTELVNEIGSYLNLDAICAVRTASRYITTSPTHAILRLEGGALGAGKQMM